MSEATERAAALAEIRRQDAGLAEDMARARMRTMRAVLAATRALRAERRAERDTARALSTAWRRPPTPQFAARLVHRATPRVTARASTPGARSVHFALAKGTSGGHAASHQEYIERTRAAVASFGTLDGDALDRRQLWKAIDAASRFRRKGSITLEADAPVALKRKLITVLQRDDGIERVPAAGAARLARLAREEDEAALAATPIKVTTLDPDDHKAVMDALFGEHHEPRKRPKTVKEYRPRVPLVQRRFVLELPHELTIDAQRAALARWCEETLTEQAGVAWWATIHQPEPGNDARNWHAHVVCTQFAAEHARRSTDTPGAFAFEQGGAKKLPPPTPFMKILGANGPEGLKGGRNAIKAMRERYVTLLNDALREAGATKRYTAKSHAARGLANVPGQHRGPARSRKHDDPDTRWRHDAPEWQEVERATRARFDRDADADATTREHALDCLEAARLRTGLCAIAPDDDTLLNTVEEKLAPEGDDPFATLVADARARTRPAWTSAFLEAEQTAGAEAALCANAWHVAHEHGGIEALERWTQETGHCRAVETTRRLLAKAHAHESARGQWTRRARIALEDEDDETAYALLTAPPHPPPLPLPQLIEREIAEALEARAGRHARRAGFRKAQESLEDLRFARHPGAVAHRTHAVRAAHARYLAQDASEDERAAFDRHAEACATAARWRETFTAAAAADDTTALATLGRQILADDPAATAARALLGDAERAHMSAAQDPTEAAARTAEHRAILALARPLSDMLDADPDPAALDATLADPRLRAQLAKADPATLARLDAAANAMHARERAIDEALANDTDEGAARALAIDPRLLAHRRPEETPALRARASQWIATLHSEVEARSDESPEQHRWRVAQRARTLGDTLETVRVHAPKLAQRLDSALTERNASERQIRDNAERTLEQVADGTPVTRKRARVTLQTLLDDPLARAALTPDLVDRVRRRLAWTPPQRERD